MTEKTQRKKNSNIDAANKPAAKESRLGDARSIPELRKKAVRCRACPLWKGNKQTVFGEGPSNARVMFIGEQPGDKEDLAGRPFVGPAGKLLNDTLAEVGIDRNKTYITNTVKHFKWASSPSGKARLSKKPLAAEINACRP